MAISPLPGLPCWVAHTPTKTNPAWHCLPEHLQSVAALAARFAEPFGGSELARYVGLLHDLGKFSDAFQQYLLDCHQAAAQEMAAPRPGSAPHKQAGARVATADIPRIGALLAMLLNGHHGGMLSPDDTANAVNEKTSEAQQAALLTRANLVAPAVVASPPDLSTLIASPHGGSKEAMEMFLRFLFSCLTDADALDTEAHHDPEDAARRSVEPVSLARLRDQLLEKQAKLLRDSDSRMVNQVRRAVYKDCVRVGVTCEPGVFTLTVPTGGGKTRSSLAFALEHACRHGLRRVVYAIPYTSIVDQTAGIFRDLFEGELGSVLEHHSAIEPRLSGNNDDQDEPELWRRLAAQNWDAPLIVTTTVQLFESLFSNRPGRCRKLHRLAKSVIVLDEVQTLPPTLLAPLLSGLNTLVNNFGATVVLCTATQPALTHSSRYLQGFDKITPIIAEPKPHFEALRRVRYRIEPEPWTWEQVRDEMRAGDASCLCVVNTRRQALELLDVLDPTGDNRDVLHLSTLLCGRHRRDVLSEVRRRLKEGPPVLLVSTQVIEAGVDVDFPKVLRAVGPLDRIIQAAGRCNREGLRPRNDSHVVVFTPVEDASPKGVYRMALERTVQLFSEARARGQDVDFDDPAFVTNYFEKLFADLRDQVDRKKVQEDRQHYRYPEVARKVRLIEEDTVPVLVTDYDAPEAKAILSAAHRLGRMTRSLWQRAQPFCVSVYKHDADRVRDKTEEVQGGLLVWRGGYDKTRGLNIGAFRDPADLII